MNKYCEQCYAQNAKPCMECNTCNPGHRNFRPITDRHEALKTQNGLDYYPTLSPKEDYVKQRLIDAVRLSETLERNFGHTGGAAVLQQLIDIQPSVDAAPVVRCRECKHYRQNTDAKCVLMEGLRTPSETDFCSYGEQMLLQKHEL